MCPIGFAGKRNDPSHIIVCAFYILYALCVAGNSCLSGDYMGMWSFDHELQIGERIIFEDMIHYTMVKTNMFNGIHHPAIAMWAKEGKADLFKQFSYEDYRDRMS